MFGPSLVLIQIFTLCSQETSKPIKCLMLPFHQGLFCPIDPIWTRLSPINQCFIPPDCRPESPPTVSPFLTRMSPDYINASNRSR